MIVRSSNKNVKGLECIDPKRNIWRLRWNFSEDSYEEAEFRHKPDLEEIKTFITNWHNSQIESKILNGFSWGGIKVYLSRDNQMNINMFVNSTVFPLTIKLGTDEEPVYYTFNTTDELKNLRNSMANYIKKCLNEGWNIKKNINWSKYIEEN